MKIALADTRVFAIHYDVETMPTYEHYRVFDITDRPDIVVGTALVGDALPPPGQGQILTAQAKRTVVSRTEYYGLFTAPEEAMIRIAAGEEVTQAKLAAANTTEKQRLMGVAALQVMLRRTDALAPTDTIDLASAQVQQGLGLLVEAGLITAERKAEIQQGV